MLNRRRTLLGAIRRWEEKGMLPLDLGASLRADVHEVESVESRVRIRALLAGTGVVVLVIAVIVLMTWAWPQMEEPAQFLLLAASGIVVQLGGILVEGRGTRWRPASYGLQTVGLVILLSAFLYSKEVWEDLTVEAVLVGVFALVYPAVTGAYSVTWNAVMPAVHTALGFAFLAVFLDRATPWDAATIVWTVDAVLLVFAVALGVRISRREPGTALSWVGGAFVASLYSALALIIATQVVAFSLGDEVVYGIDAWWVLVTGITLWGIHLAPEDLRREWYDAQLGSWVLLGVALIFWTLLGPNDVAVPIVTLSVGAFSALFLIYGNAVENVWVLVASCIGILIAAWYYGAEREGLLPTAIALGVSASILIGVSVRLGGRGKGADPENPGDAALREPEDDHSA